MLLQAQIFSRALQGETCLNILLPQELTSRTYPILYLLHGMYGGPSNWLRYTSLERYVEERQLVVVLPEGKNSFYLDTSPGSLYETYITEELPSLIQRLLPVSDKPEDRFIAGLSMGGYGAVRAALLHPESYGRAGCLSGVLDFKAFFQNLSPEERPNIPDPSDPRTDLALLANQAVAAGKKLPPMFISCGTDDMTYPYYLNARKWLGPLLPAGSVWHTASGGHDWSYWDAHIQDILNWLPLQKGVAPIIAPDLPCMSAQSSLIHS